MKRLVYVSESRIALENATTAVDEIVAEAQIKNSGLNVTGVLIFTGKNFAQILEGPHQAVDDLMISIMRDGRHQTITILDHYGIILRRFSHWKMAYYRPSPYIARYLEQLLQTTSERAHRRAGHALIEMAGELYGHLR